MTFNNQPYRLQTAKTGLLGLTRAVALEVARTDITCNAICPRAVLHPRREMQRDGTCFEKTEEPYCPTATPPARS